MSDEQTTKIGTQLSDEGGRLSIWEMLSRMDSMGVDLHQRIKELYVKVMIDKRSY